MTNAAADVSRVGRNPTVSEASAAQCPNCKSTLIAEFCAQCGERQPSSADYSAKHLAFEALSEFLSIDGRLWRSVVALLSKPGFLTVEYFSGRRGRYMRPFSLFVLLNVFFFFVQPYTGLLNYLDETYLISKANTAKADQVRISHGMSKGEFKRAFADEMNNEKKSLLLIAIPVFAVVLLVLYARSGHVYVEHLVFSVHLYAFIVFFLAALGTVWFALVRFAAIHVYALRPTATFLMHENGIDAMLAVGLGWYLLVGLRRYYHSSWWSTIARATVLFGTFGLLLVKFRDLLFYTTLFFL